MAVDRTKRESFFPAIEKRYGEPIKYWIKVMAPLKGAKYPEQMAHLQENFGFSRAHANALVMYLRGSESSRRFEKPKDFFDSLDPVKAKTAKKIFQVIRAKYPKLEFVIAWNQPMLKDGNQYIFGLSAATNHLLIAPFDPEIIKSLSKQLTRYKVNKKTIQVPVDWQVDEKLLLSIIRLALKS
jgi:uncharacterized protein YdhG (YjbR/CyaY superfamily)